MRRSQGRIHTVVGVGSEGGVAGPGKNCGYFGAKIELFFIHFLSLFFRFVFEGFLMIFRYVFGGIF